jgi:UDP-glucose 4-epimerase
MIPATRAPEGRESFMQGKPTSLVTGGAGFMGSHVADHLIKMGHDVVVLDDLSGGFRENLSPDCEFVQASVMDHDLINRLFEKHHFDYVYHLAAYAAEGLNRLRELD